MTKKINLVYVRVTYNKQPISNNYNLNYNANTNVDPHLHLRLPSVQIHLESKLPDNIFLYELNWDYGKSHQGFFDEVLAPGNIPVSILDRLQEKTAFLLLTVLHEGWATDPFFTLIHESFLNAKIPLSQIIYVSNCFNIASLYCEYCERHNIIPEIKNEYCPTFRIDRTDVEDIVTDPSKYLPGLRKKTFLCFNRRFSDHRLLFYMLIEKHELLDHFFFSMSQDQPESSSNFLTNAPDLTRRYPEFKITMEDIVRSNYKLPLVLDSPNFNKYPMEQQPMGMKKYYVDSLINIVSETYFFNNIIHITEKTYKPVAFMQPFIMLAAPFSLKHIRDMGFKTFNDFWDESYDEESDHVVRMNKIFNLVSTISKWSDWDKINFSHRVSAILKYNKEHLKKIKNIEMEQFVEKYGT